MHIWSLPGPSSFVDEIEHAVRDGTNVIARFPSPIPNGLERELRERLYSLFDWSSVDASCTGLDPVAFLRQRICPEVGALRVGSIAELADTASFQGRLVWIEKIGRADWATWSEVLVGYADACRNVDLLSRTVFIVLLSGETVAEESPEEVALVRRDFRGVVDTLDLFVFALWNASGSVKRREHRALLAHTVAQVAQWDYSLAEQLLSLPLAEVLSPEEALRQYVQNRGWTAETPECWEKGTIDGPTKRPIVHSALLSVSGGTQQVSQRIWAAQAAVLLPLVEERRVGLIERYRRYFALPIETEAGVSVYDPRDLEVGQIAWHLDRPDKPHVVRERARRLRHVRNQLAHMEPLEPEQALHRMLFEDP